MTPLQNIFVFSQWMIFMSDIEQKLLSLAINREVSEQASEQLGFAILFIALLAEPVNYLICNLDSNSNEF